MSTPPTVTDRVLPSHEDPVARGAAMGIGGPVGRHARLGDKRFWVPLRVLIAFAVLVAVAGWGQKAACRTHPWAHEYQYTRFCYSDVFALYYAEGLDQGKKPYLDHPVEYPVVIGAVMEVGRRLANLAPHGSRLLVDAAGKPVIDKKGVPQVTSYDHRPARYYDVTALLLGIAFLVLVVTSALLAGRRRIWDGALVALAPIVVLHLTTNWDMIAVALTGLAMLAWARRRPAVTGLVLGLAVTAKLYPVLLLAPLLFLCMRAGRWRAWLTTAGVLIATVVAVYLPVYVAAPTFREDRGVQVVVAPSAWQVWEHGGTIGDAVRALAPHTNGGINATYRFIELNRTRPADWDSLWYAVQHWRHDQPLDAHIGPGGAPTILNTATAIGFLVLLAGIAALAFWAPRRPRLPQLAFLTVLAFLVTSKVDSPQYVLWLLPLAALARPRWRLFLVWQATEALVLLTRFLFFVHNDKADTGIDVSYFITAVLVRDLTLLTYAGFVVWEILHPDRDVVRDGGVDDPAGGILDGAPDARRAGDVVVRAARSGPAPA